MHSRRPTHEQDGKLFPRRRQTSNKRELVITHNQELFVLFQHEQYEYYFVYFRLPKQFYFPYRRFGILCNKINYLQLLVSDWIPVIPPRHDDFIITSVLAEPAVSLSEVIEDDAASFRSSGLEHNTRGGISLRCNLQTHKLLKHYQHE